MNVPNIGQGLGSVTALPRAAGESDAVATRSVSLASGRSGSRNIGPDFARLAWFDVNGDGELDPRSAAAGGDATLLVSSYAVDFPTYTRTANQHPVARPVRATPGNVAQTNRAVGAYQRYGQSHAAPPPAESTAPTAPTAPAAPTPTEPAVAVTTPVAPATPPVATPERAVA